MIIKNWYALAEAVILSLALIYLLGRIVRTLLYRRRQQKLFKEYALQRGYELKIILNSELREIVGGLNPSLSMSIPGIMWNKAGFNGWLLEFTYLTGMPRLGFRPQHANACIVLNPRRTQPIKTEKNIADYMEVLRKKLNVEKVGFLESGAIYTEPVLTSQKELDMIIDASIEINSN
mgnify:CR=1 FL=1